MSYDPPGRPKRIGNHALDCAEETPMGLSSEQHPDHRPGTPHAQQDGVVRQNREPEWTERKHRLVQSLTHDLIARLVSAQLPSSRPEDMHTSARPIGGQEVLEFAQLVLGTDEAGPHARLDALRASGIPHARILTELLMPVAAHMGRLWEHDVCDFHDVTLAVGRLQRLLRHPEGGLPPLHTHTTRRRRVLLSTCRSEQHTFGLSMVAEFFHQAGWDVTLGYLGTDASPVSLVREQWFDVAGLSLGSGVLSQEFGRLIEGLRKASLNRHLPIIVGGPMFMLHPAEYSAKFKVDAILTDASQAPDRAEQLLSRQGNTQLHETAQ